MSETKAVPERVGCATRRTAAEIAALVGRFPKLGEDVFVHEEDYNEAENGRIAATQDRTAAEVIIAQQKGEIDWFTKRLADYGEVGKLYDAKEQAERRVAELERELAAERAAWESATLDAERGRAIVTALMRSFTCQTPPSVSQWAEIRAIAETFVNEIDAAIAKGKQP